LELTQNDIEVWVDENVGRPNCSMGMTTNMQPGQCGYETMRPSNESLTALLLGQAFEGQRFITQETMKGAICFGAGKQHTYSIIDKI
jgi:hypothetical protein